MEGLLGENKRWPVQVRSDPITDHYVVETRPFARGKFASVRRCRHLASGAECAAKYMRKRRRAQDVRHEILHEARVLALSARHPHIVRMHEVYETQSEIVLVLELVPGGELQRVLDDEEAVEEREAARLLRQILDGVAFLHLHKIAHLDIKPQNLLLTKAFPEGEVKLCDFGISRLITKGIEIREIVGTPDYVAPEVLHYEPISLPTDMWSLGVLTYVLLSGHSPFGGESKQETFCNITRGSLDFPQDLFSEVSQCAIDFIRRLLIREPRERMTAEECLSHPWLSLSSSPLSGICLTLTPEGAPDDPPSSPSLERRESPLPRTEEPCKKSPTDPSEEPDQNTAPKSPSLQSNDTSDCSNVGATIGKENSRLFCKRTADSSHEPSLNAGTGEFSAAVLGKVPLLNEPQGTSPSSVTQNVHHRSPLPPLNGASDCSDGAFCKTTKTGENKRLLCKSATDSSHEPAQNIYRKSAFLLSNGSSDYNNFGFFCKTTRREEESKLFYKTASGSSHKSISVVAQDVHHKTSSDCSVGAFCKLSETVAQSSFCKSPLLQRNSTAFGKNNSSDAVFDQGSGISRKNNLPQHNGETKESKSRSVDMVVSQFEGVSKRIVFSEEIILDERVGMVY